VEGGIYELWPWDPQRAQQVVDLIDDYPNTLPRQARGEDNANYYAAFYYASVAQSEALLRFPDAAQAEKWRWGLAYNLARIGDPGAGAAYAELIGAALNRGETDMVGVGGWFRRMEPRFRLVTKSLGSLPGYLSAHVLQIDGPGSAFLLIRESSSGFSVEAFANLFDFSTQPEYRFLVHDLTADGISEITIFPTGPLKDKFLELPRVYDVSAQAPSELPYYPSDKAFIVGTDYENRWSIIGNFAGQSELIFKSELFPACPLDIQRSYHWQGEWLVLGETTFDLHPNPATLAFCQLAVDQAASVWGPAVAAQFVVQTLPDWPPQTQIDGTPYPADAKDEWRYRLGIYHALAGESDTAIQDMQSITASPSLPSSSWVKPASDFLEAYSAPEDLYRACVGAQFCSPRQALEIAIESLPAEAYATVLQQIGAVGAAVRSSGYFDFDGDGVKEIWFTVRHRPGERLEFWLLVAPPPRIEAIYVESIDSNLPALDYYQEEPLPPIVLLENTIAFRLERIPDSLQPYLTYPQLPRFYPDRFRLALAAAKEALFSGVEPTQVQEQLLAIQDSPGLLCRAFFTCDEYYYLLGLTSELAGDENTAIESYLQVWWDSSKSPFTSMVRLRLKGQAVLPSATPTPTTTGTIFPTATATITGTPPTPTTTGTLSTPTGTSTPTATPEVTLTETPTGTPTETVTPTTTQGS